ncbi:MAG: anthranilate phosphoribosyltransferase [Desulfobacteraceae bacterium]|nr:MAG: anthranilate phosphoribosyltransferase [Desulfobacteraceae bacterium]
MIKDAIVKVVRGSDLGEEEMKTVMDEILSGGATGSQIGSLLTALRMKGETVEEISGAALALKERMRRIDTGNHLVNMDRDEINLDDETIVDTCGTGGDGTCTFNVSTATAFVVAGAGIRVAKHGQRAVSSHCGSADVLEALGIKLDLNLASLERCIREIGIGFLYAPLFYSSIRYPSAPRREIGIRTLFNLLGPLTNPAGARVQVMGVYAPELTSKMARVLKRLGSRQAFVVCGEGTFDEISICGPTKICRLKDGQIREFTITPEQVGLRRAKPEEIRGGKAEENAWIIREVLDGRKGAVRDIVLLNAAAAFIAAGVDEDFAGGLSRAADSIDNGLAREKLSNLISFTGNCGVFTREGI